MNESSHSLSEREIFLEALNRRDPVERAAYLHSVCGDDPERYQRVEALLENLPESSFLESPALDALETAAEGPVTNEGAGCVIGRYKLLERLGEGGFGTVWAAEQREPVRRRVALKIIKLGMDTKQVVARFEAERQALAMMDHPNIAKVLDAGMTDAGRPYFVMELVRGIPITQFCEQEKTATKDRIALFILVCRALQHAHQKGIIHRDVKPSNILVTLHDGVPVPKVIDFGIAKATQGELTDKTIYTQFQQFIGTPAYMSPEQAEMSGLDIDTRSDVYSLGALLYELLTGTPPFDVAEIARSGLDGIRRIIREREPLRPSTRVSQTLDGGGVRVADAPVVNRENIASLRGDLDWIVMKCLEKDRSRRYETANGLALDLRRHLQHEPVLARPPSAVYRMRKAWRRHKVAIGSGIAVTVSLVIGLSVSLWQTNEAQTARASEKGLRELAEKNEALATDEARKAREAEELVGRQAEAFRHMAYASDMNQAKRSLELGNLTEALSFLNRHRPEPGQEDIRGWEWRYLRGLCRSDSLYTLATLEARFVRMEITSDGEWLCVYHAVYDAGTLFIHLPTRRPGRPDWLAEGSQLLDVSEHAPLALTRRNAEGRQAYQIVSTGSEGPSIPIALTGDYKGARFTNDGLGFVTVSWDEKAKRGAEESPRALRSDGRSTPPSGGSVLPDGRVTVTWWRTDNGERRDSITFPSAELGGLVISPDGRFAAGRSPTDVTALRLWELTNGRVMWEAATGDGPIGPIEFTPDSRQLVSTPEEYGGALRVWDTASGALLRTLRGHRAHVTSLNFMEEGRILVTTGADHTVRTWDMETGDEEALLRGHSEEVRWGVVHPDGRTFYTASFDMEVRAWRPLEKRRPVNHFEVDVASTVKLPTSSAESIPWTFTDNGRSMLLAQRDGALVRLTGRMFQARESVSIIDLEMVADFNFVFSEGGVCAVGASEDGDLFRWDFAEDRTPLKTHLASYPGARVLVVHVSAVQSRVLIEVRENGTNQALMVRLDNGETMSRLPLTPVRTSNWTSDWPPLLAASVGGGEWSFAYRIVEKRDGAGHGLIQWNGDTQRIIPLDSDGPFGLGAAISPQVGLAALTREPHLLEVFSMATGERLHQLSGHLSGPKNVVFSPDGSRLITSLSGAEAFTFWVVREERLLRLLTLEANAIFRDHIRWSPDGSTFGSLDNVGRIHLWRAPSWEEIAAMEP